MSAVSKCAALALAACLALIATQGSAADNKDSEATTLALPGGGTLDTKVERLASGALEIEQVLKLASALETAECKVCCSSKKPDGSTTVTCVTCPGKCTGKGQCQKGKPVKPCDQ